MHYGFLLFLLLSAGKAFVFLCGLTSLLLLCFWGVELGGVDG